MKEVAVCDTCGEVQGVFIQCRSCGIDMCQSCWEHNGRSYPANVDFSSHCDDGHYCHSCDHRLRRSHADKLHAAYRQIEELRLDQERWNKTFAARQTAAEALVRRELRLAKRNEIQPALSRNLGVPVLLPTAKTGTEVE